MASNFLVTLLATASELLNDCGIPAENVTPLLLPLVQASVDNLARLGPEQGLTGPIVRGDCDTISSHLAAIEKRPELSAFYKIMAHATVELAVKSQRLPSNKAELLYKIQAIQT